MPVVNPQLPWLAQKDFQPNNAVTQSLIAGAQIAQEQQQQELRRRQVVLQEQTQHLKNETLRNQAEGTVMLGTIMSEATANNSWTDPATRSKVFALAQRYPWLPESDLFKGAIRSFDNADKSAALLEREKQRALRPPLPTTDVRNINQIEQWKVEMRDAIQAGDFETGESLKAKINALEAQTTTNVSDTRTLDELGQPYVEGSGRTPTFIQTSKGAIHKLPQDFSGEAEPITDVDNNVIGYGVRTGTGAFRVLPQVKPPTVTMPPENRAAMGVKNRAIDTWWKDLSLRDRAKPENQKELARRIAEVQREFATQPGAVTAPPAAKDPLGLFQ